MELKKDNITGARPGGETVSRPAIDELRRLVRRSNRRWKRLIVVETLAWMIAAPLGYLWLIFFLDNVMHLPVAGRAAAIVIFFAVVIALLIRCFHQWRQAHFSDDQVALAIERQTAGQMENRLINSIQLARDGGGQPLSRIAIEENYRYLKSIHLAQAARSLPAMIYTGTALFLIVVGVVFWSYQRQRFTNAATRIFLPFAKVAPMYRTLITVKPGDIQIKAGEDVAVTILIEGRIPKTLSLLRQAKETRSSEDIAVPPGTNSVAYVFKAISQTLAYAVRGGDYVTPFYTIDVPVPCEMKRLRSVLHFPVYTRQPERSQESVAGDIEALQGTTADLTFTFNQPLKEVLMLVDPAASSPQAKLRKIPLKKISPFEFTGTIVFQNVGGYYLEMVQFDRPSVRSRMYDVHVLADQPPDLQLAGIDDQSEMQVDSIVPLTVAAKDDYGLSGVGLFCRKVNVSDGPPGSAAPAVSGPWRSVRMWSEESRPETLQTNFTLSASSLDVAEGDFLEIAVRGQDNDPLKSGQWTTGQRVTLTIGGSGTALQKMYEQLLRSETELNALILAHDREIERDSEWLRKLDFDSGLRWDDKKNLDALANAMRDQARNQTALRGKAADMARHMVEEAGNLRLSLGMLSDTEMIRAIRIFESVAGQSSPQGKRSVLADARLTQERIVRSLREIAEHSIRFRQEWEMANMVPFVKMLAEREQRLAAESGTYAGLASSSALEEAIRIGAYRRQSKLLELSGLAQVAFSGMGKRMRDINSVLSGAFTNAADAFDSAGVKLQMRQAADHVKDGQWASAAPRQQAAVAALAGIHSRLVKLQADAAQQVLADIKNLAADSVEVQKEIATLQPGTNQTLLLFNPDKTDPGEIVRFQKLAEELKKKKQNLAGDAALESYFEESMKGMLTGNKPTNTDFSVLKLATKPSGQLNSPSMSGLAANANKVEPLDEKFQDLVGDLLEEADDLREKYDTYNLNLAGQGVEEGEIGKQAGDMNALSGAAATGNMKPPSQNIGGASRSGRQGARAHGAVIGDEAINRRGRDEAQEGQEEVPDQAGTLKEKKSADPQKDTSTGIGGKKVSGTENTSFSTKHAGNWKDEMAQRMAAPQDKNQIVERQGKPLNPQIAAALRDLTSTQEQVIERIKTIKKQLDNLYLPSDQLDEIIRRLAANLDRLKESPDPEIFRMQAEALDQLKGAIVVFNRPSSEFQPSLVRPQSIRGEILDESAVPTLPGYEEAVKRYYEKLVVP